MKSVHRFSVVVLASLCAALQAFAADYPAPIEGDWIAREFRFPPAMYSPNCGSHTRPSARRPASPSCSSTALPARPPRS